MKYKVLNEELLSLVIIILYILMWTIKNFNYLIVIILFAKQIENKIT